MVHEIFYLILEIYQQVESLTELEKKSYLLKLFLAVGIFPHDMQLYQALMIDSKKSDQELDSIFTQALVFCWQSENQLH